MTKYTWLTEIAGGASRGWRIVRRDSDGMCALVSHDECTGQLRVGSRVSSPAGDRAIEYVISRWRTEADARRALEEIEGPYADTSDEAFEAALDRRIARGA